MRQLRPEILTSVVERMIWHRSSERNGRNIVSSSQGMEAQECGKDLGRCERKTNEELLRGKSNIRLIWLCRHSVPLLCLVLAGSLAVLDQSDSLGLVRLLRNVKIQTELYISALDVAIQRLRAREAAASDSSRGLARRSELLVLYRNALDAQARGNLDEAIATYSSIVAHAEVDAALLVGTLYNRGIAYDRAGNVEHALADLDGAIALAPDYGEAYQNRATIRHRERDLVGAFEDYSKAYDLLGGDARKFAMAGRAVVFVQSGNLRSARVDLATSLSLDPEFGLAQKLLRDVEMGLGRKSQATTPDHLRDDAFGTKTPAGVVSEPVTAGARDDRSEKQKNDSLTWKREGSSARGSSKQKSVTQNHFVQLGALASEGAAEALVGNVRRHLREVGGNVELQILRGAAANGRVVYRVWVGPVAGLGEARQLCRDLQARSQDCFVVRPEVVGDDKT